MKGETKSKKNRISMPYISFSTLYFKAPPIPVKVVEHVYKGFHSASYYPSS